MDIAVILLPGLVLFRCHRLVSRRQLTSLGKIRTTGRLISSLNRSIMLVDFMFLRWLWASENEVNISRWPPRPRHQLWIAAPPALDPRLESGPHPLEVAPLIERAKLLGTVVVAFSR